ncbi:phage tail assembly chaperone [Alteraurantiacibacter palmitatis]|uniref:Phage tail assembly chaperone n=1 Tax=Alteraurantiacibacter palmitatis TaxID=2054628 RepID=A0ABV7E8F2_9SPHN
MAGAEHRFAAAAQQLAGLAARGLGWTPETFWNATPAELAASLAFEDPQQPAPVGRHELAQMMERDAHGRPD